MIAYHFPPLAGSSGIQRTLRFAQQLPDYGWQPIVLTIQPHAYERCAPDLLRELPPSLPVERAFGLDSARHLAIGGRYPGWLARPDRWTTWRFDAVRRGLRLIREHGIQALWSTYPIATAHVIGAALQRRSGLPWIADFRDPMAQENYPADPATRARFLDIEKASAHRAAAMVFTTPGAARIYQQRYPNAARKMSVLENGYDEASFADVERKGTPQPLNPGHLTVLHSGIVYPWERDPTHLLMAIATLKRDAPHVAHRLRLRFRAPVHEDLLKRLATQQGVTELIEILPATGYKEALAEMLAADALLVLQAANCNEQIPAKLYEALRCRRPVLCLSDPNGDTVGVLRALGLHTHAALDDATAIARLLTDFVRAEDAAESYPRPDPAQVALASRDARTAELARLLGTVTAGQMGARPNDA
ncbi:glycosyltransferase [Roseateles sp. DC23W]|uniref:Glycosyltransferase n=1 Tax=Pelomonas dachongensis TaxID=3299029 RepID=A0ABW7EWG8_9BURK